MPNWYALLLLLCFFICLGVGCFVYFSSSRKPIHTAFLFLCLFNAYLAFGEFMMNQANDLQAVKFWAKVYSFWIIVVVVALHFVLIYTGKARIFRRWWVWILMYGPFLVFPSLGLLFNTMESSFAVLKKESWGYSLGIDPTYRYGVLIVLPVVLFGYTASVLAIIHFFRQKHPLVKKQAAYVALGFIIPSILSILSGALPATAHVALPDVTAVGAAIQEILVGLAIWRFDLFELSPAAAANNILATMSDMMIITDNQGYVVSINDALTRNLGYTEADLLKTPISAILKTENPEASLISADPVRMSEKPGSASTGHFDGVFTARDGRILQVGIIVSRLKERTGHPEGHVIIARDMTDWKRAEEEKNALIAKLQDALANIKTLKGMIPICASCKKVRNDRGFWQMVEEYISEHSEVDFSHGICEDCLRKLYPEFSDDEAQSEEPSVRAASDPHA